MPLIPLEHLVIVALALLLLLTMRHVRRQDARLLQRLTQIQKLALTKRDYAADLARRLDL